MEKVPTKGREKELTGGPETVLTIAMEEVLTLPMENLLDIHTKAVAVADELERMGLREAAKVVREGYAETLAYTGFPQEHWRRIRTSNAIERINREIRRRTRVVGTFPDGRSALMLVTARLKYVAESEWGSRRYLDASRLDE